MRAAVYPVSRVYYEKVLPSVKSLMVNSDIDEIFLTIEDDQYPGYLPECVHTLNVRDQRFFDPKGPNIQRTPYVYLCMLRVAYGQIFSEYDRILALDADTIVMRDIGSEPWDMDLQGCHFAGVPECLISQTRGRPYANAGVLLFDLDRIRRQHLDAVMLEAINTISFQWLEQDCINAHLKMLPIGSEWNACQFTSPCDDPKIRHWAYERTWEESEPYLKYAAMSWEEAEERWKAKRA